MHPLPQFAQGAEDGNPHVDFASVEDLRYLPVGKFGVKLEGDDLLVARGQLPEKVDKAIGALLPKEALLRTAGLMVEFVLPGRCLEGPGGRFLLAPMGGDLVPSDGEEPGAEGVWRTQRLLLDEGLLKDVRYDVQGELSVLDAAVDVSEDLGEVLTVEFSELADLSAAEAACRRGLGL